MNRLFVLLIVATLALPAFATDDVCWDRGMERIDTYGNPPSRGDNNFFTFTVSGTANVTMLYPGTKSMRALPVSLYEYWTGAGFDQTVADPDPGMATTSASITAGNGKGCSSKSLNAMTYFMPGNATAPAASSSLANTTYNNLTLSSNVARYPEPETTYSGGGGLADNFEASTYTCACKGNVSICSKTNCPTDKTGGKAWQYMLWPSNDTGVTHPVSGLDTGSIDSECADATGSSSSADFTDCEYCVRNSGYWLNYTRLAANPMDQSPKAMVVKGNWLNFNPPKWAILRLAYKRLVNGPLLNSLREGIVTSCNSATGIDGKADPANCTAGDAGEFRLQKMLPQSCNGAGRPSQRISSVDGVKYNATSNPLAEMLFNVAWTVSGDSNSSPPATWSFFSNQATHPSTEPGLSGQVNAKDGFCPGCNSGFSILFSDGRGIDGWKNCSLSPTDIAAGLTLPAYCRDASGNPYNSYSACDDIATPLSSTALSLGAEKDGDNYLDPNMVGGAGTAISGLTVRKTPAGTCTNDLVDDVASWMHLNDMNPSQPGTKLKLHSVEIGTNQFGQMAPLSAAAAAGDGMAIPAQNFAALEAAIQQVFHDIIKNATSFSVAAITTVQTRGTTFAFIPRFRPLLGSQWEGRLYRFRLFNEFAKGCSQTDLTCGPDGGPCNTSGLNPNVNASCNDLYLQEWAPDGGDGGFVGEDSVGNFVQLDTSVAYTDAGWPIKAGPVLAKPVWEAAHILECRANQQFTNGSSTCDDGGTPIAPRNLMTVGLDAGIPTTPTALVRFNDFSDAGIATMTNYMKLGGVNSDFCQSMSLTSRTAYTSKEDCGRQVMRFMEGKDVLKQNESGGVVRPNILGDIFHSSPVLVTPPAPVFLCETGLVTQCVRTLYAEDGPCGASDHGGLCTPNSSAAYKTWYTNNAQRQELILVGANDGMLHAFQAGTYQGDAGFDEGTGVEVWAFIPPDMLPKLQRYVMGGSHQVLMDGSPWVRDIWKDGSGSSAADGKKDPDEFHTIAVVGERGGGRHYTALDITDTGAPDGGAGGPRFLWTWPPIGSQQELVGGETWNDTTPNPPPIGPILMLDETSGPINVTIGGVVHRATERWVALMSGGYDPNLIRGRAMYVIDAWTGEELFQFSRYDVPGAATSDVRSLLGPVAAPAAMVDSNFDNFFDVAAFGDAEGKVWTIDMLMPGGTLASPNWYGGLTFAENPSASGYLSGRSPFFAMAGARVFDDGRGVRVYLGSGDRDQIRVRDTDTSDGGTCQVDNLRGCIRNNCTVDVNQQTFALGTGATAMTFTGEWKYTASNSALTTNTFTLGTNTAGVGDCTDPAQLDVEYQVSCPTGAVMRDPDDGGTSIGNTVYCDFDGGNDAGEECPDTSGKPLGTAVAFAQQTGLTNSRFYSINLFDAPSYLNRPRMTTSGAQGTYNSHRLTDADLGNADVGDAGVASTAPGWYVQHARDPNEKTASGALLLGGCVVWNTLVPQSDFAADAGQTCGVGAHVPPSLAYLYQANDDSGAIQCGLPGSPTQLATSRYQQRTIAESVPQQPTPVISLNAKTGQAGYSGVMIEPGNRPIPVNLGSISVQGDVSWLDVSRNLHNCRHPADGGVPVCN